MKLVPFENKHIQQAAKLAELNFEEQNNSLNNVLPKTEIPDLRIFAENGLGAAALDEDKLIGFLVGYGPIDCLFGNSDGIWSPLYANGTIEKNRDYIYSKMYQYISGVWVDRGILSHSITLYADDAKAVTSFFNNGFGKRCVDGIIKLENLIESPETNVIKIYELNKDDFHKVYDLSRLTVEHLQSPPVFIPLKPQTINDFSNEIKEDTRIFAAEIDNEIVAYIKIQAEGETFISRNNEMVNITGAYLKERYRGKCLYSSIIYHVAQVLKEEGYTHLGVDYESINPTANNFWSKHFVPYTYSLARRIDERILKLR